MMSSQEFASRIHDPGNFLHFQLRDLLMIVAIAGGITTFFLTRESSNATVSEQVRQLREIVSISNESIKALGVQINTIDKRGTEHEQSTVQYLNSKDTEHDRRLTNMEAVLQQVVPDVREIKTKVQLVADMLEKGRK